jgi:hypothetical protein
MKSSRQLMIKGGRANDLAIHFSFLFFFLHTSVSWSKSINERSFLEKTIGARSFFLKKRGTKRSSRAARTLRFAVGLITVG